MALALFLQFSASIVHGQPALPEILVPPSNTAAFEGTSAVFKVTAAGNPEPTYQWQFNGEDLIGATSSNLVLSSVAPTNAGLYRVIVSNIFGTDVSLEARLLVTTLGGALNCTNVTWIADTTFGPSFFPELEVTHDGIVALQNPPIVQGGQSFTLLTTVDGPGTLKFWWRVQTSNSVSIFRMRDNGSSLASINGNSGWQQSIFYLGSNSHSLDWTLFANGATPGNPVTGWLDEVSFLPGIQPPEILKAPTNQTARAGSLITFRASAEGAPPLTYQWQHDGVDLQGGTNSSFTVTNAALAQSGMYGLIVSNLGGQAATNFELSIIESAPFFLAQRTNFFALTNGEARLWGHAVGSPPLAYQWRFEGNDLPGETNEVIRLGSVGTNQQGRYSVRVTNPFGTTNGPSLNLKLGQVRRVIHLSIDGLAAIHLARGLQMDPLRFSHFKRLTEDAAWTFNARCDASNSFTVPNHLSMLTGRPVLQPEDQPLTVPHGYTRDDSPEGMTVHKNGNTNVSYKASVFDVVHDRGMKTAFLVGKLTMAICASSYNSANGAPDLIGSDNGPNKIDSVAYDSSSNLVETVVNGLLNGTLPQYTFLHFADPDLVGHSKGWASASWYDELEHMDSLLDRLFNVLDFLNRGRNASTNQTILILTADHGGGAPPTHHSLADNVLDFTIPLVVWGPGFPAGADLYSLYLNRADPGTNFVGYNAVEQPLRNGDSGNMALACLGLPFIPGSSLTPLQPALTPGSIDIRFTASRAQVSWSRAFSKAVLETSELLSPGAEWTPVTGPLATNINTLQYSAPVEGGSRFYRLKTLPPE